MGKILNRTLPLLALIMISGCASAPSAHVARYVWVTGLKPDKAEHYEYLHSHPRPAVNQMIKDCHIQNYSIYEREIGGKIYLFSYLEYTGTNFDADMKLMAADPATREWWKATDPCQQPLPDAAAKGKIWSDAKEVFHLQ
jgi:L-rhamnose mutarotase